jgi:sulfur carrier protein
MTQEAQSILITINGTAQSVGAESHVPDVLCRMDIDPERPGIAVAINEQVVRRTSWAETSLSDGDVVEIITATQGG